MCWSDQFRQCFSFCLPELRSSLTRSLPVILVLACRSIASSLCRVSQCPSAVTFTGCGIDYAPDVHPGMRVLDKRIPQCPTGAVLISNIVSTGDVSLGARLAPHVITVKVLVLWIAPEARLTVTLKGTLYQIPLIYPVTDKLQKSRYPRWLREFILLPLRLTAGPCGPASLRASFVPTCRLYGSRCISVQRWEAEGLTIR